MFFFTSPISRYVNIKYFYYIINLIYFINNILLLATSLKSKAYRKALQAAIIIGKNLGFDLEFSRALCLQLRQYKENQPPFDLPFGYGYEEPYNWWNLIDTSPNPNALPRIAQHLFAICPNSASCERGFSNLGWLTNQRRLNLGVEKLESMCKMITYWKSNARKEFGFYGQTKKLNDREFNQNIIDALVEPDDIEEEEETQLENNFNLRRTTSGEIIPNHNVIVLIEKLWIEENIDLTNQLILEGIGKIPEDDNDDDFIDEEENEDNNNIDKGIMDYNIKDLVNEYA